MSLKINAERLLGTLQAVNKIGYNAETGGLNRVGYSDEDFQSRKWLMDRMRGLGMEVRVRSGVVWV